jgi:putative tricarboxylic transport membrane protein
MSIIRRDVVCGVLGLALASLYYAQADALPKSLLADAVGADGVPKSLAIGLALCSVMLVVRALATRAEGHAGSFNAHVHLRALGVVGLGAAYAFATPLLGYPLAIALLIGLTAIYFGLQPGMRLVLVAALGAAVFWTLFAKMLGVPMPSGAWLRIVA